MGIRLVTEESFLKENDEFLKKLLKNSEIDIPIGKDDGDIDE
jgi:hypothetical protein